MNMNNALKQYSQHKNSFHDLDIKYSPTNIP